MCPAVYLFAILVCPESVRAIRRQVGRRSYKRAHNQRRRVGPYGSPEEFRYRSLQEAVSEAVTSGVTGRADENAGWRR